MSSEGERRLVAIRAAMEKFGVDAVVVTDNDSFASEEPPAAYARRSWASGFTGSNGTGVVSKDKAVMESDSRYTVQMKKELFPGWESVPSAIAFIAGNPSIKRVMLDKWCSPNSFYVNLRKVFSGEIILAEENVIDIVWEDRPALPNQSAYIIENTGESPSSKINRIGAALINDDKASVSVIYCDQVAWALNLRGRDYDSSPLFISYLTVQASKNAATGEISTNAVLYANVRCILGMELPQSVVETHGLICKVGDETEYEGAGDVIAASKAAGLTLSSVAAHLAEFNIKVKDLSYFSRDWSRLTATVESGEGEFDRVSLCPNSNCGIFQSVPAAVTQSGRLITKAQQVDIFKACKNPIELAAIRDGHKTDGLALSRFLHWLDKTFTSAAVVNGEENYNEWAIAEKNWWFRYNTAVNQSKARKARGITVQKGEYNPISIPQSPDAETDLVGESFPCLSQFGPNSAMPHYSPSKEASSDVKPGNVFLCDSGAQYARGCTTDVTRTVYLGIYNSAPTSSNTTAAIDADKLPSLKLKESFTRVLAGFLDCCDAKFPGNGGANGTQLDAYARQHLWAAGLDFGHGTGHGVGSFGLVHEPPVQIRPRMAERSAARWYQSPLFEGMVSSVEPGLYLEGEWGIRIEDLVEVVKAEPTIPAGVDATRFPTSQRLPALFGLAHLTLAPISRALIDPQVFNEGHIASINKYHQTVYDEISAIAADGIADEKERDEFLGWLKDSTAPIASPRQAQTTPPPQSMYA